MLHKHTVKTNTNDRGMRREGITHGLQDGQPAVRKCPTPESSSRMDTQAQLARDIAYVTANSDA
jgi:hypothetical protein